MVSACDSEGLFLGQVSRKFGDLVSVKTEFEKLFVPTWRVASFLLASFGLGFRVGGDTPEPRCSWQMQAAGPQATSVQPAFSLGRVSGRN